MARVASGCAKGPARPGAHVPQISLVLRDLEGGHRTEADHIVGDMLKRARAAGVDPGPLRAAYAHLQAHEARRKREGA